MQPRRAAGSVSLHLSAQGNYSNLQKETGNEAGSNPRRPPGLVSMPVVACKNVVPERPEQPRRLVWLVDSLDRLTGFPPAFRQRLGFALYQAQIGHRHESAKMLHGFGETVWQVRADDQAGTYSAVYVAQFRGAVYALHAFQKKATSGIATPQRELV
jgi:phage-related protein